MEASKRRRSQLSKEEGREKSRYKGPGVGLALSLRI